jgi:hypothetical protein
MVAASTSGKRKEIGVNPPCNVTGVSECESSDCVKTLLGSRPHHERVVRLKDQVLLYMPIRFANLSTALWGSFAVRRSA